MPDLGSIKMPFEPNKCAKANILRAVVTIQWYFRF